MHILGVSNGFFFSFSFFLPFLFGLRDPEPRDGSVRLHSLGVTRDLSFRPIRRCLECNGYMRQGYMSRNRLKRYKQEIIIYPHVPVGE